jgi:Fe-S-cluster-containing hydrogenase component 2
MKTLPPLQTPLKEPADTPDRGGLPPGDILDAGWLKALAMQCGADAAGLVEPGREALKGDAAAFATLLPGAGTVVALAVRVNPEALRTPWMGVANREAGFASKAVDDAASELSRRLMGLGVRSVAVQGAFPMDAQKWPGKMWAIAHKILAEQAGLGRMGHHRLLIHPVFGTAVLLSAVLLDRRASGYDAPLAQNPCNGCKLCVAACPTGAIAADGSFSLVNCATHNYRYRLGGFNDWVENVVESRDRSAYRKRVPGEETVSMWQALAYGTNYTCLNCLAVCPAGTACAPGPEAPRGKALVDLLQQRGGSIFVLKGSDAEAHAERSFPPERIRRVRSGNRVASARAFLQALPVVFQPGRAEGLDARFHFDFTGADPCRGTVVIRGGKLQVTPGLEGRPDLVVTADGPTWTAYLAGEARLLPALLRRRIRIKGAPSLLKAFSRCFPG